ncbi:unnamed protein product [Nezara viridula]|uniref:Otopetrin-2 n=1 Tax=Nezara viridula TaxID=85310 RepID=A0A9P0HC88_NEZVI|nr:unnamed protein product [Nezara viridula]
MELATISEKDKESDSSNASLLDKHKNRENPFRKKSKFGLASSTSLAGTAKTKRERSHSMPFIAKGLQIPKTDTAKICFENMSMTISGLYCNLLVVLGMSFPIAEVLSAHVPASMYEAFYLYLYLGSLIYLIFIYLTIIKKNSRYIHLQDSIKRKVCEKQSIEEPKHKFESATTASRYGSFYLRMGAAAFGIGSMIYSGLEFGQYFELVRNVNCSSVLMAVTPAVRMAFVMIQLQFIFMSDKQKNLSKYRILSKFGLMHMIATNLSVWLNVLIQETKHEIVTFFNPHAATSMGIIADFWTTNKLLKENSFKEDPIILNDTESWLNMALNRTKRGLHRPQELYKCRRANIMGSLLQNAAPFLFPCTIEYSLICAVILYALWKNVSGKNKKHKTHSTSNKVLKPVTTNTSQYFTVDCANAHKGLFASFVVLVFTIISLIMFFALIKEEDYATTAVFQVNLCELTLYVISTLATVFAMYKIKYLPYEKNRHLELDTILLVMAQTGLYIYFMFSLIAGYFTREIFTRPNIFVTAIFGIIQSSMQTLFIIDAWWRRCITASSARKKPARQLVTFLLISNLAMWAINHLENARADFHPIELRFYGVWAWTIITHLSMPLAVFYRFHSTVCLCEIWKCTYKMRLQNDLIKVL